jgi:hypothetical protein
MNLKKASFRQNPDLVGDGYSAQNCSVSLRTALAMNKKRRNISLPFVAHLLIARIFYNF